MYFDKNPKSVYGNRLFHEIYPQELNININSKNFVEVNEGEFIFQVGDNSDSLYLLLKGLIKIKVYGSIGGISLIQKFDNDFFGENEVFEEIPRKSTAMAVEKSLLYIINGKELNELIKNKTILVNLFNPSSESGEVSQKSFDELETSNEFSDEYNINEISQDAIASTITPSLTSEDFDEGDDDLSWNNSNIDEFKDIFNGEELLEDEEVTDFSISDEPEFDYDKTILSNTMDQSENKLQSMQHEESELLFNTKENPNKIENIDDSILDQIKKEINQSFTEVTDKHKAEILSSGQEIDSNPLTSEEGKLDEKEKILIESIPTETTSYESNLVHEERVEQLSDKEYHELSKRITELIYDEVKNPIELIKKYADILMQKSSSTEADKILQKIINQSNNIIDSLQTQADYYNEKIKLKTQVLYATSVLNDILLLLAGYTEFRKVKLFRKFEADASIVLDKNLFYQANLQIIKFLCENITGEGSIFVTTNRTKETFIVEFKSNGPTLSDELLKKISGNFISIENPGLSFSRRIIIEHNGTLVTQNSADSGPEIKVLLPIVK